MTSPPRRQTRRTPKDKKQPPSEGGVVLSAIALAAVAAVLLVLHLLLLKHSGAFWRDECSSINLAHAPTWGQLWSHLPIDSFPGLFASVLRCWIGCGAGASDFGIRLLGILISLGTLYSVFLSCRAMQVRVPVLAVCLVGLNAAVFYSGSSIRAYGLAALLIVACFAAFWRVAVQPTRGNMILAFVLAVLSVHCNYQNSYLLFGIGTAAAIVALPGGNWRRSGLILAMCFVAALSMLVYWPAIAAYRSGIIVSNYRLSTGQVAGGLFRALGGDGYPAIPAALARNQTLLELAWIAGLLGMVYSVLMRLPAVQAIMRSEMIAEVPEGEETTGEGNAAGEQKSEVGGQRSEVSDRRSEVKRESASEGSGGSDGSDRSNATEACPTPIQLSTSHSPLPTFAAEPSPGIYCLLTLVIAAIAGTMFFKAGGMHPFPWQYIPFIALCGVAIECGIGSGGLSQFSRQDAEKMGLSLRRRLAGHGSGSCCWRPWWRPRPCPAIGERPICGGPTWTSWRGRWKSACSPTTWFW